MYDDTVEVLVYPTQRVRGRDIPDYTATPTATPIYYVDMQPSASVEETTHRVSTSDGWDLFVREESIPAGVELTEKTLIRWRGNRYEVEGKPAVWTGLLAHTICHLIDWAPG